MASDAILVITFRRKVIFNEAIITSAEVPLSAVDLQRPVNAFFFKFHTIQGRDNEQGHQEGNHIM